MRKLIYAINLTLDGCCDHTKGIADAEIHDFYTKLLLASDTFVYGRKTYGLMVPYWPEIARNPGGDVSDNEFANAFVGIRDIVVFSRSLQSGGDEKTRFVTGDSPERLREEILSIKNMEGKPILTGGVDLPGQLIALDLIDEYIFLIQPLLVGEGRRLPTSVPEPRKLELLEVTKFDNGGVAMRYGTMR
ncbi:MAG: dihydrofolate reductase family protein [Chitinophagaceae bacterium]